MRDIKFRAWDRRAKDMLYRFDDCDITFEADFNMRIVRYKEYGSHEDWDELDVMQYTGIKDLNGNELYEGDVIMSQGIDARTTPHPLTSGRRHYKGRKLKVEWKDGRFVAKTGTGGRKARKYPLISSFIYESSYILIGNIYQHPELIKKHTT